MLDEGNDLNLETTDTPPEEKGNKTFLIVGGIMAAMVFLTLVCMAIYLFAIRPGQTAKSNATKTALAVSNQQEILGITQTAEAALWTPTLEPSFTPTASNTRLPVTATVSNTPVLVPDVATETPETDPATLAAMQTQLSQQMTSTAVAAAVGQGTRAIGGEGTPSGMPATGFFDDFGLPTLAILTVVLLAVIFVARRLRKAPAK